MIAILKYFDNNNGGLFSGSTSRLLKDKILIQNLPYADFPYFDITTDSDDGDILRRRVGEFAIKMSLLQSERSVRGSTILEFLRDTSGSYRYMFAMEISGMTLLGAFSPEDVSARYNYNQNEFDVEIIVRGLEEDFKKYLTGLGSDFSGIGESTNISFEEYMTEHHLEDFNIQFPQESFAAKCGDSTVKFRGRPYRRTATSGFTNWSSINRWQTFTDLYRGLGFDFYITLENNLQFLYDNAEINHLKGLLKIKIFWQTDIINSQPIVLSSTLSHEEMVLPKKTKKSILMRFQEAVYEYPDHIVNRQINGSNVMTGVRGILLTENDIVRVANSEDTFVNNTSYRSIQFPFFMYSRGNIITNPGNIPEDQYLLYIQDFSGFNAIGPYPDPPFDFNTNAYLNDEIYVVPLSQYSCPHNLFAYNKQGVVAYPRFFAPDNDNFQKVMRFSISNYKRYLISGNKKMKTVSVVLKGVTGIEIYRRVRFIDMDGESDYYVSKIIEMDYVNKQVSFEAIEL